MSQRGVTLGEVVLSIGLLVVVILTTIQLALVALNSNTKSSDEVAAEALAQETLETFIYGLPPSSDSFWTTGSFASPYQQDTVTLGRQTISRALYVTDHAATMPNLRAIRVRLSWGNGEQGRAGQGIQTAEVTRLVAPP